MEKQDTTGSCPKCKAKMRQSFGSISGNSKYVNFVCTQCGYKETKCIGLLPEKTRF
jgi:C4-type Zn-finger protein